jgi:hypothetical protein
MKISKNRIKQIVREEFAVLNEQLTDFQFIINQISFDMRRYSNEKKFVDHLSKETSYDVDKLKNVFRAYQKLSNTERYKMETPHSGVILAKKFLVKHGIK